VQTAVSAEFELLDKGKIPVKGISNAFDAAIEDNLAITLFLLFLFLPDITLPDPVALDKTAFPEQTRD
jgi:hypothetical protein